MGPRRIPLLVLRELDIGPDGNWTDGGFRARYQSELANGLGNLVNRSLSMLKRYRNGVLAAPANDLADAAAKSIAACEVATGEQRTSNRAAKHLDAGHPRESIRGGNRAVQTC